MSAQVKAGKNKVSDLVEKLRQEESAEESQSSLETEAEPEEGECAEPAETGEQTDEQTGAEEDSSSEDVEVIDPREQVKVLDKAPCDKLDDLSEVEAEASDELVRIVEGLIFASPHPLHVREAVSILEEFEPEEVQAAFKVLSLGRPGSGLQLARSAQGYRWTTDPGHAKHVQRLVVAKPQRLSRPQLETLAVVAYRQPVTRPEIDHIRGVDSQATLKALVDRELIAVVGQTADPGRPRLYGTTLFFLEYLNITELDSLPPLGELSDLSERTRELLRSKVGVEEAERLSAQVLALAKEQDEAAAQDDADSQEAAAGEEQVTEAVIETVDDNAEGAEEASEDASEAESESDEESCEIESDEEEDSADEDASEADSDDEESADEDASEVESDEGLSEADSDEDEESTDEDEESTDEGLSEADSDDDDSAARDAAKVAEQRIESGEEDSSQADDEDS